MCQEYEVEHDIAKYIIVQLHRLSSHQRKKIKATTRVQDYLHEHVYLRGE